MRSKQTDLFSYEPSGEELRDQGIAQAVGHANAVHPEWAEEAYNFLLSYMRTHAEFMAEDVREASYETIPKAPSNRAWGGIIRRAVVAGYLMRIEYRNVKNPKAHCAPCTYWGVIKK